MAEADVLYVDLREDRGTQLALDLVPGVALMLQPLHVGDEVFNLVVPDVDAVMDAYIAAGREEDWDPYWARPWPSAAALAAALLGKGKGNATSSVRGAAVAELGAGLGLAGLAAAAAGAQRVVLMDREPAALVCAALSAIASGIEVEGLPGAADIVAATGVSAHQSLHHGQQDTPVVQQQQQQQPGGGAHPQHSQHSSQSAGSGNSGSGARGALLPAWPDGIPDLRQAARALLQEMERLRISPPPPREGAGAVALQTLDWSGAAQLGKTRFDVLLACDVLYESYAVAPIAELAPRLLFSAGGRLLLTDPAERTVQNRADFVSLVGRGKVGLGLEAEASQLVAIDGQQPMMGGGGVDASVAAQAANRAQDGAGLAPGALVTPPRQEAGSGDGGGGGGGSGTGSNGSGGGSVSGDWPVLPAAEAHSEERPGSVVAVRLMSFRRSWDVGTVAPQSTS